MMCPPSASDEASSGKQGSGSDQAAEFEIWQDEMCVSMASAPKWEDAWREALHYAAMYRQDGPVEIYEVTRRLIHSDRVTGSIDLSRGASQEVTEGTK